jgi:hypothetical protein
MMERRSRHGAVRSQLFALIACAMLVLGSYATAQTGRIEGTVRDDTTGEPVPNAQITLLGSEHADWMLSDPPSARTDARGYYLLTGIPVGNYDIEAHAVGYERTRHLNQEVTSGVPVVVNVVLRPLAGNWQLLTSQPRDHAVSLGFGIGVTVGIDELGGDANQYVQTGTGVDLSVGYVFPVGIFLRGGTHFGILKIDQLSPVYTLAGWHAEAGFVARELASRWAPFVAARIDLTREQVESARSTFSAWGTTLSGGGGAFFRVGSLLTLEGGLSIGAMNLGDYTFWGDHASYVCLEGVDAGTSLIESTMECGSVFGLATQSDGVGYPIYNCYPPFTELFSGQCERPEIPREHTARSGTWYRVWFGVHIALGEIR